MKRPRRWSPAPLALAVEEHNKILAWQKKIIAEMGKRKARCAANPELPAALIELYAHEFAGKMTAAVFCGKPAKDAIHELMDRVDGRNKRESGNRAASKQ